MRSSLVTLVVAASMLVTMTTPAFAAAPRVFCMTAYASDVPPKCDPATFHHEDPFVDEFTAISNIYGYAQANASRPDPGTFLGVVHVEGNATPGSRVTITIADGPLNDPLTRSMTETVIAAADDDPGTDERAGDFRLVFDPVTNAGLRFHSVQELGVHSAAEGASPSDGVPSGESRLTISATAVCDGGTSCPSGMAGSSSPLAVEIVKYAATAGDTSAPGFSELRFPPEHWCHFTGPGMTSPFGDLGGNAQGQCSDYADENVGALPDVTWIMCTRYTSEIPDPVRQELGGADETIVEAQQIAIDTANAAAGSAFEALGPTGDDISDAADGAIDTVGDVTGPLIDDVNDALGGDLGDALVPLSEPLQGALFEAFFGPTVGAGRRFVEAIDLIHDTICVPPSIFCGFGPNQFREGADDFYDGQESGFDQQFDDNQQTVADTLNDLEIPDPGVDPFQALIDAVIAVFGTADAQADSGSTTFCASTGPFSGDCEGGRDEFFMDPFRLVTGTIRDAALLVLETAQGGGDPGELIPEGGGSPVEEPPADTSGNFDESDFENPFRGDYCQGGRGPDQYSHNQPHQVAPISGRIDDLASGSGLGSEIRSVVIEVVQGETVLYRWTDRYARSTSTTARWGFDLNINDLPVNRPDGVAHQIRITAMDAWGNTATTQSGNIWVYPY